RTTTSGRLAGPRHARILGDGPCQPPPGDSIPMILPRRTTLAVALSLALGATASVASATTPVIAALPSVESIDAARGNASLLILRAGIFDPVTQHLETQPMGAAPAGD